MSPKTRRCLVWLGFIFSLFCVVITGIDMSFNVYALLLKETFSLHQTQVEIVASTGTVGLGLTFIEPLLSGRFGYPATFLVTFLLNPATSGFLAWASHHGHYFHSRPVYIYIVHLLMCTSNTMVTVTLIGANIKIFPKTHSGKIIGLMNAVNCVGEIVYGAVMDFFFGHNLSGFFLTICISSIVCFGICYRLLYPIVSAEEFKTKDRLNRSQYEEIKGETKHNVSADNSDLYQGSGDVMARSLGQKDDSNMSQNGTEFESSHDDQKTITSPQDLHKESRSPKMASPLHRHDSSLDFLNMLRSRFFHLSTWPAVVFYASTFTCMNNITAIAAAARVHDPMIAVYIIAGSIMVVRVGFGVAFDKLSSELWGIILMIISYLCFGAAMVIGMFWLEYPGAIYVVSALAGIGMGPSITIPLSLIVLRYGRRHFQGTVGMLFIVTAVAQISLQIMFGVIYDSHRTASTPSDNSCIGPECFYWSFLVLLAITGLVTLIQFVNLCWSYLESQSSIYVVDESAGNINDSLLQDGT